MRAMMTDKENDFKMTVGFHLDKYSSATKKLLSIMKLGDERVTDDTTLSDLYSDDREGWLSFESEMVFEHGIKVRQDDHVWEVAAKLHDQ